MSFCAVNSILAQYPPGIKINPLSCNRWSCPECCEKRRSRLKHEAYRGRPNAFITITVNPAIGNTPDQRARDLKAAWTKVRRKAQKLFGNVRLPFIAVFEETKAGEPHLHILLRLKWIPQAWLSEEMNEHIGAPVVDIRRIRSKAQSAAYVAKYIGKNPEKFAGTKRYWRSLDWFVDPKKEYVDAIGTASSRWFTFGTVEEITKAMGKKLYRYECYEFGSEIEHWLKSTIGEDIQPREGPNGRYGVSQTRNKDFFDEVERLEGRIIRNFTDYPCGVMVRNPIFKGDTGVE